MSTIWVRTKTRVSGHPQSSGIVVHTHHGFQLPHGCFRRYKINFKGQWLSFWEYELGTDGGTLGASSDRHTSKGVKGQSITGWRRGNSWVFAPTRAKGSISDCSSAESSLPGERSQGKTVCEESGARNAGWHNTLRHPCHHAPLSTKLSSSYGPTTLSEPSTLDDAPPAPTPTPACPPCPMPAPLPAPAPAPKPWPCMDSGEKDAVAGTRLAPQPSAAIQVSHATQQTLASIHDWHPQHAKVGGRDERTQPHRVEPAT